MRIAITGATGFIGRHLVPHLQDLGHDLTLLAREDLALPGAKLAGIDALIHLAAIAHARGTSRAQYDLVNRDLPLALADAALAAGVRRFVFVSSINAATRPDTPYGASKAAAERGLLAKPGIETVVVRPAPVYGVGARGNFALLQRLAASHWPLPFAGTRNRRSVVAVASLADALGFAATRPGLGGSTFTVTDPGPPLTLAEIVTALRAGMGRRPGLFPAFADFAFPASVMDGSALFTAGWIPELSSDDALRNVGKALR